MIASLHARLASGENLVGRTVEQVQRVIQIRQSSNCITLETEQPDADQKHSSDSHVRRHWL